MDSQGLVAFVGRVHGRTYKAVELLTDGALRWRPREGEFSAGETALHISNSRLMTLGALIGSGSRYRGHSLRPSDARAEVRQAILRSSKKVIANLSDMDLALEIQWGATGALTPRWMIVLGSLVEHEVHHRSQLCSYLAELGIEPPALHGVHVEELTMVGVVTQRGRVGLLALIVGIAIAATSWSSAQAAIFDVAAQDNAFKPQVITINPGDTVIWTNFDAIDHVVQSKVALLFFRPLPSGQIATIAFLSPGVYEYEDPAHDGMIGTIIVRGPSPTASATATNPPSPTATATVTPSPTATQVVNLPSATAPPSPTATTTAVSSPTRAPGPPNTGSGVRASGASNTPLIIIAIGLCLSVAVGSGVIARRARPRS